MKKQKFEIVNQMRLTLPAISVNEGVVRAMVGAFIAPLDPNVNELADIKCAVSEAVTNVIVHAYRGRETRGEIRLALLVTEDRMVVISVRDTGCGIADITEARRPLFTTDRTGERSGMGFAVMESFTDRLRVTSRIGRGTTVTMYKQLS